MKKVGERSDGAIQSADVGVDADAVRTQVERVVANPLFQGSKRYTNLLRYVVARTLAGQHENLKERVIGIEVFKRPSDYDTSLDATVRVAATEVRKRLTLYYNEPGHDQELRITVPVGSYLAEFELPEQKVNPPEVLVVPERRRLPLWYFVLPLTVVVLALAGWGVRRLMLPVSPIDAFWAPLLDSSGPVVVSVGVPPKSVVQPSQPDNDQIAVTDISAADDLVSYLRRKGKDSAVRPASDTSLSDLRSSPVVILGFIDDQWATQLEDDLRFRIRSDAGHGKLWIEDTTNPANRQWSVSLTPNVPEGETNYALISRVQYLSSGQWWLGIAGLTGRGTQVAHQSLIDPKAMTVLSSGFPRDWEHKNLQIVLETKKLPGGPGTFRVIATHFW